MPRMRLSKHPRYLEESWGRRDLHASTVNLNMSFFLFFNVCAA